MNKKIVIIGIILLIVGVILAVALIPLTTLSPKQLEDEVEGKEMEELKGESWTVSGKIDEKAEIEEPTTGQMIYTYKFEDSDVGFMSSDDIASEGEDVIVTIEITDMGPEAQSTSSPAAYYLPGIIILIIGVIILIVGIKKKTVEPGPQ
jgi:hypothetical protein